MTPPDAPKGTERHKATKEDAVRDLLSVMSNPEMYAGEGFTDTNEIARPDDVAGSPGVYGAILDEEGYWPASRSRR